MTTTTTTQQASKPYIGMGMEGPLARWYAKTTRYDLENFRREAREIATQLPAGAKVLEVAPGPGYFSIELAKAGRFLITALDISYTFVEIAQVNARAEGVAVDFCVGNASAMPFEPERFNFIFCRAAFKNFSQPVEALNEMHRVLHPGGRVQIVDLRKDVSMREINKYFKNSGRSWLDTMLMKLTFRALLIKRAYTKQNFEAMARQSHFGGCEIETEPIGLRVHLQKSK